jgi:maltokinase
VNPEELLQNYGVADPNVAFSAFLPRQRWFSGRDRGIERVSVEDAAVLQESEPISIFSLLRVDYTDGASEQFHVPLSVRPLEGAADVHERFVAEGRHGGVEVIVADALGDPEAAAPLWRFIATGDHLSTGRGELRGRSLGLDPAEVAAADLHPLPREQSNTSLVNADRELLKLFRGIRPGRSTELEMLQALAGAGFTRVPPPLGVLEYTTESPEPALLGLVQPYIHNGTEGWALALTSLRDLFAQGEELGPRDPLEARQIVDDQGSDFVPDAIRLGAVTAEMHLALASDRVPHEMRARPIDRATLKAWADEIRADLARLLESDDGRLRPLREGRARLLHYADAVERLEQGGVAIRYHGDYHLGQVVRTDDGWVLLDFEGEPDRTVAARRAHGSPLRDVAGMLRSFDYATGAALLERCRPGDQEWEALAAYGDAWAAANREAFWESYVGVTARDGLLPDPASTAVLLRALEVQKAIYETAYELGHRPEWTEIPMRYLRAVMA